MNVLVDQETLPSVSIISVVPGIVVVSGGISKIILVFILACHPVDVLISFGKLVGVCYLQKQFHFIITPNKRTPAF